MAIIETDRIKQRSLINTYWRRWRQILALTTAPMLEMITQVPVEQLRGMANRFLDPALVRTHLIELWGNVGTIFASEMYDKILEGTKAEQVYDWEQTIRAYMFERSLLKANAIMTTQAETINRFIDVVLSEGMREGWSIDQIILELQNTLGKDFVKIQSYHAERIARTEVIGASNKGSFDGALKTGMEIQKGWLTSGLKGVRDSHLLFESYGFVSMNYEYAPGLKFPGDERGSADEIINCRCTIIYNTD